MNLLEAVKEAKEAGLWFRPVSWKGRGGAFSLSPDKAIIEIVPTANGGDPYMTYLATLLLGEWELVTPDEVCNE